MWRIIYSTWHCTFLQKKNYLFLDLHQDERSHLVMFFSNDMDKLCTIKAKEIVQINGPPRDMGKDLGGC